MTSGSLDIPLSSEEVEKLAYMASNVPEGPGEFGQGVETYYDCVTAARRLRQLRGMFPADGYARAYKEGWNSASMGALAHQNPYPNVDMVGSPGLWKFANAFAKDFSGQSNYNLWLSGYADYVASPFNCEAARRYLLFSVEGVREFVTIEATCDEETYSYTDGSAILLRSDLIRVLDKTGAMMVERPLEPANEPH